MTGRRGHVSLARREAGVQSRCFAIIRFPPDVVEAFSHGHFGKTIAAQRWSMSPVQLTHPAKIHILYPEQFGDSFSQLLSPYIMYPWFSCFRIDKMETGYGHTKNISLE